MQGKILIVDDNEFKQRTLLRLVQSMGHQPVLAENGVEGLLRARHEDPDVILLDIVMPEMNGIECLEELKADGNLRRIPVIIISSKDSSDQVVQCIERGAVDHLRTDAPEAILKARINSSLRLRQQQRREAELNAKQGKLLLEVKDAQKLADELLHAIFPHEKVKELKETNDIRPTYHENVAMLFCDVVGFTRYCSGRKPEEVIVPLQTLVESFEECAERHGLEKIKTIGDCFMAAGGLLATDRRAVLHAVKCGMDMVAAPAALDIPWQVRVGIHVGPLVAGKIGKNKYTYDVWGDTVNTASRVQSKAEPETVVVSRPAWQLLEGRCRGASLGVVHLKGKSDMELFRIDGVTP